MRALICQRGLDVNVSAIASESSRAVRNTEFYKAATPRFHHLYHDSAQIERLPLIGSKIFMPRSDSNIWPVV
jgi:hypothetical protein